MDRREQDVLDQIRKQTEDIDVPESLKPDNVSRMLEGKKPKRRIRPYQIGTLAAACVAAIIGIAVWTDGKISGTGDNVPESAESGISESKTIASADSYEQIYQYIEEYQKETERANSVDGGVALFGERSVEESAVSDMGAASNTSGTKTASGAESFTSAAQADSAAVSGDYSQTNVRQEGVDEGDVVKTDGTYLYVLEDNGHEIGIVNTRNQNLEKVAAIDVGEDCYIYEFYLAQKKLVAVCSRNGVAFDGIDPLANGSLNLEATLAVTYDIQDPQNPVEEGRVSQSGNYNSSRMSDGYLYLFSEYYMWGDMDQNEPRSYVPLINGDIIKESSIYLPQISKAYMYEVITSIDPDDPDEVKDSKAIFSKGGQIYVSNENIYFYETEWGYNDNCVTTIRKVAYKDGELTAKAQGQFGGYLNDSFSIDEYEGNLRVVTTEGDTNSVYVLDKELEIIGSIEDLAEDERVYSARFMGDTGYFVTFRETDPLFSVDLSNPKKPKILGALKIPGFSEYLHFYGEDKLLGIGMNVDEETMTTDGVKLSMFDISDKADVKEEDTYILKNVYSTDVSYDYKAVLVDQSRNIIGFAGYAGGGQNYYLFEYDEDNGFNCNMEEEINGNGGRSARGVYIGDILYVVQGNIIEAYSLKDYIKVDDLIL